MAMKQVDVSARRLADLHGIRRKIEADVKAATCNKGRIEWHQEKNTYVVGVQNDGLLGKDLSKHIKDSKFAHLDSVEEYEGAYDWASDTYVRPESIIRFHF